MNTSINLHAWVDVKLQAEANCGSHGSCILKLKAGETEFQLFLPVSQYPAVVRAATLLDPKSNDQPDSKPFHTYPEDRAELLRLCSAVDKGDAMEPAYRLSDLVRAILEDEAAAPKAEAA